MESAVLQEQRLIHASGRRFHGPIRHNFEVHTTVSLGSEVGLLERGRRFVLSGDQVRAVDAAPGAPAAALEGVLRVPAALGGGFVFHAADAVFHAPRFDARLTRLGSVAVRSFTVGVGCVLLSPEAGKPTLVRLRDGKPIAGVPAEVVELRAHASGFMLGLTSGDQPTYAYFTKDART